MHTIFYLLAGIGVVISLVGYGSHKDRKRKLVLIGNIFQTIALILAYLIISEKV